MTPTIHIPVRPKPELHLWTLPPPCGDCESCETRAHAEYAVTFMSAHYARAVEVLDQNCPGWLRAVDLLVAERDLEVARIMDKVPYCDTSVTIDVGDLL